MTSPLKIANNTLGGVVYTPRTNSLNSFYAKALKLQRDYAKYAEIYMDGDNVKKLSKMKPSDDEYYYYAEQVLSDKYLCNEIFLTSDLAGNSDVNNAVLLTEIMLNETINHSQERTETEYLEYLSFMVSLLTDFFQKFNPLRHFGSQLASLRQTINQETPQE